MTLLTHRGQGPWFGYAGQPMHILAGQDGLPLGSPPWSSPSRRTSPGPSRTRTTSSTRRSTCSADGCSYTATTSRLKRCPARCSWLRAGNPSAEGALVLGIWAPPEPALAFMREIGAALSPDAPPDPERMRDIYTRHVSRLPP